MDPHGIFMKAKGFRWFRDGFVVSILASCWAQRWVLAGGFE